MDTIEKYIIEFDYINIFLVLSLEGLFGFLICLICSFSYISDENNLKKIYSENSLAQFSLFIFLLFVYLFLCGGRNAFRVVTNKIYSPMTKTLTDYFLNPIYLIINYSEKDFVSNEKRNFFYFILNFVLSVITSFSGSVYNEIIILFFCGLEKNTHNQISQRANLYSPKELIEKTNTYDDSLEYKWETINYNKNKI